MVRVDAPPASDCPSNWRKDAFKNLAISTPLCWKYLESSVAIIASTNTSGNSSYVTDSLFWAPSVAKTCPSLSYSTVWSWFFSASGSKSPVLTTI